MQEILEDGFPCRFVVYGIGGYDFLHLVFCGGCLDELKNRLCRVAHLFFLGFAFSAVQINEGRFFVDEP